MSDPIKELIVKAVEQRLEAIKRAYEVQEAARKAGADARQSDEGKDTTRS